MKNCLSTMTVWLATASLLAGCAAPPARDFKPVHKSDTFELAAESDLALFEAPDEPLYVLGSGDKVSLQVWGRPELSGAHTIGPDGKITVPLVGPTRVANLTREEAALHVKKGLSRLYTNRLNVNFGVEQYTSNRITVLGRVQVPGVLSFDNQPTLLEVLAKAGSLPVIDKQATLVRCAVFRGRDKVMWVDLQRLLALGHTNLNIRMRSGDLVYIPDSADTTVYVLGAVVRPGAYRLTPDMSVMDLLGTAGGPNEDADAEELTLYRPSQQLKTTVKLQRLMDGKVRVNYALEDGDILYVPRTGLAEVGYMLRQISAGLGFATFGLAVQNAAVKKASQ